MASYGSSPPCRCTYIRAYLHTLLPWQTVAEEHLQRDTHTHTFVSLTHSPCHSLCLYLHNNATTAGRLLRRCDIYSVQLWSCSAKLVEVGLVLGSQTLLRLCLGLCLCLLLCVREFFWLCMHVSVIYIHVCLYMYTNVQIPINKQIFI